MLINHVIVNAENSVSRRFKCNTNSFWRDNTKVPVMASYWLMFQEIGRHAKCVGDECNCSSAEGMLTFIGRSLTPHAF